MNLKKHIQTLTALALDKWNELDSEINDTCAFCDDAVDRKGCMRQKCQVCLCPPCLCDMGARKWPSAVNFFLDNGCIYVDDAMDKFPLVMQAFRDILQSLVEHGDVGDILVEKMEDLLNET